MSVPISVPIAVVDENYRQPHMDDELDLSAFTPAAKIALHRIYRGLRDDGGTLANGASVDSTDRVFQWLVEAVAANTYVVPAEADVKLNVQYGAAGTEFTGSYSP